MIHHSFEFHGLRGHLTIVFFFNDTATTEIYTLSLHDALPIWYVVRSPARVRSPAWRQGGRPRRLHEPGDFDAHALALLAGRSEEHTSELQSLAYLVCRLLLEKKKAPRRIELPWD